MLIFLQTPQVIRQRNPIPSFSFIVQSGNFSMCPYTTKLPSLTTLVVVFGYFLYSLIILARSAVTLFHYYTLLLNRHVP